MEFRADHDRLEVLGAQISGPALHEGVAETLEGEVGLENLLAASLEDVGDFLAREPEIPGIEFAAPVEDLGMFENHPVTGPPPDVEAHTSRAVLSEIKNPPTGRRNDELRGQPLPGPDQGAVLGDDARAGGRQGHDELPGEASSRGRHLAPGIVDLAVVEL